MACNKKIFNIGLIGNTKSKKTTFVKNLVYGNIYVPYIPTIKKDTTEVPIRYNGNIYKILINDYPGNSYLKTNNMIVMENDILLLFSNEHDNNISNNIISEYNKPYFYVNMWEKNAITNTMKWIKNIIFL